MRYLVPVIIVLALVGGAFIFFAPSIPLATVSGTLNHSCAIGDKAAFTITLDDHVSASVFSAESELMRAKDGLSFAADIEHNPATATIDVCDNNDDNCRNVTGTIAISRPVNDFADGMIVVEGDKLTPPSRHKFHVSMEHNTATCG